MSKAKNKDSYGFWAVVAGLATLVVAVMLAVFRYQTAIEATGLFTAVGTVVGMVFRAYFVAAQVGGRPHHLNAQGPRRSYRCGPVFGG
jgi:hypothetical protein